MLRLVAALMVSVVITTDAIKFSAQIEKDCGEQLLATLAKEANANMKTLMQKLIDNVQKGEIKASQSIINRMDAAQKQYATDNYWVRACLPMKSCLECPVEL